MLPMPRSILTNLMGRTRAGLGLKFAPAAAAPDDRSQQPLLKRLDRETGKQVFAGPAVVPGLRFELKLFGREVPCSRPSATRELEVIARRSACEASQRGTHPKHRPHRTAQHSIAATRIVLPSNTGGAHNLPAGLSKEDILRNLKGYGLSRTWQRVEGGPPRNRRRSALHVSLSMSTSGCRGRDSFNGCHEATTDISWTGSLFCLSPPSLLTALHSVVFLFQKSKPFFVILSFSDEQWMST